MEVSGLASSWFRLPLLMWEVIWLALSKFLWRHQPSLFLERRRQSASYQERWHRQLRSMLAQHRVVSPHNMKLVLNETISNTPANFMQSGDFPSTYETIVSTSWVPKYNLGAVSIRKTVLPGMAIPMLKIRRPNGRLIFNMEIAIRR